MIESGTHTPGIDPAWFQLHPSTAMRWERPHPSLEGLIADYFVFDSEGPDLMGAVSWMLPSWPAIRFVLADKPMTIVGPGICWSPLPEAGFYGSTSKVLRHTSHGGVTVGVNLTPAGVARLADLDLSAFRDRMVPLGDILAERPDALVRELRASDQGPAVKSILDRFFLDRMREAHRDEMRIMALNRLLLDEDVQTVKGLGEALDMPPHGLRRLAQRRFGFPPKTLLTRTRFLRSLMALKARGAAAGYEAIDDYYTDTSHFLRDSERFLGMTARRFLQLEMPFLDAILRARRMVLDTATPALGPDVYRKR